jgi:hypothetical protein
MITDANLILSNAQTCLSTAVSTNVIDLQTASPAKGPGTPIWLHVKVNTALASESVSGGYYQLQHCASSGGTYVTILQSGDLQASACIAGFTILDVPLPALALRRFIRGVWVSNGVSLSAGALDSLLVLHASRA